MSPPDEQALRDRVAELEAQNAEQARLLRLYAPPTDRLPGNRVVLVFFSLIGLSMVLAFGLWTSGKRTARERALRSPPPPSVSRVDQAGWLMVQKIHTCLGEVDPGDTVDVRLEARLAPAGTLGLIEAAVRPNSERFVPCVRQVPSQVRVVAEPGTAAPAIEVRYVVERPQESNYQARWSWRQLP